MYFLLEPNIFGTFVNQVAGGSKLSVRNYTVGNL
jgi:hypothetical protein